MTKRRYGIGIAWDLVNKARPVDLDLQCLIVDYRGRIVDAVYYNNLSAMNRAVDHSGDELTGEHPAVDEAIWITPAKLSKEVQMLLFVVAAPGNGYLVDAANSWFHVMEEEIGQLYKRFKLEQSKADVDLIAMMEKSADDTWTLYKVEEVALEGEHFMDILEPTIGDLIRRRIPNAPSCQRVSFQMDKGGVACLPMQTLKRLNFCVEAHLKMGILASIDLDISAVFINEKGQCLGAVHNEELCKFGVVHSGEAECDEDITVDILQLPRYIHQVFIVVNLYSSNNHVSFADLQGVSCRATDQDCKQLANFALLREEDDVSGKNGAVVCRLVKAPSGRWELEALGRFCTGTKWRDSLPTIQDIFQEDSQVCPDSPGHRRPSMRRHTQRLATTTVTVFSADEADFHRTISMEPVEPEPEAFCKLNVDEENRDVLDCTSFGAEIKRNGRKVSRKKTANSEGWKIATATIGHDIAAQGHIPEHRQSSSSKLDTSDSVVITGDDEHRWKADYKCGHCSWNQDSTTCTLIQIFKL